MSPAERLPPLLAKSVPQSESTPTPARNDDVEADAEPPFATLPDISERDLQADTLAFERVGRRGPRNWGWLKLALAVIVLGAGGAGAWKMWGEDYFRPAGDEIALVRAPDGPFKVRPDNPGGAEIRDRDKQVYELLEPGKKAPERPAALRPRPEAPLPPPVAGQMTAEAAAAASEESSPQLMEGLGSEEDDGDMAMVPADTAPVTPGSPAPERVVTTQRPPPPPAPPAVKGGATAAPASTTASATDIPARAFKIQLGAVRSEAAARSEWLRLQKQHPPVLGRLALNIERADLGTKGIYFRIQAGPFNDRAAADAACQELSKQKVPCLPIRPES